MSNLIILSRRFTNTNNDLKHIWDLKLLSRAAMFSQPGWATRLHLGSRLRTGETSLTLNFCLKNIYIFLFCKSIDVTECLRSGGARTRSLFASSSRWTEATPARFFWSTALVITALIIFIISNSEQKCQVWNFSTHRLPNRLQYHAGAKGGWKSKHVASGRFVKKLFFDKSVCWKW